MKARDIQNFDFDVSGKIRFISKLKHPEGGDFCTVGVSYASLDTKSREVINNYFGALDEEEKIAKIKYFGLLDESSIKEDMDISVSQRMLSSGNVHQTVITKNYVASGNPVPTQLVNIVYREALI